MLIFCSIYRENGAGVAVFGVRRGQEFELAVIGFVC